MNATQWAAWIGAIGAAANAAWNIYTKVSAGPKLELTAWGGMVQMPPPQSNPTFIKITLQNRGTAPTTVNNFSFHSYESRWKRLRRKPAGFNAVLNDYQGPPFPRPLEIGGEWVAMVRQEGKLDELICAQDGLWVAVHHSFAKHPTQVKVNDPTKKR
jgi:hypothetical protein